MEKTAYNSKVKRKNVVGTVCNAPEIAGFGGDLTSGAKSSIIRFVKINAGWSSLEARRAHNPKVTGSNPVPATL